MVSVGIMALVLITGYRAGNTIFQYSDRQAQVFLAQLCVDNAFIAMQLSGLLPNIGVQSEECLQGKYRFILHTTVQVTPNPAFRRVDTRVETLDKISLLVVSKVIGTK